VCVSLTEAQTRIARIDVQLASAGWGADAAAVDFEAEYKVAGVGDAEEGFVDYVLPATDGMPLAIVEAKRAARDALAGMEQARLYSEALVRETGAQPFVYLANGDEIWFWDLETNPRRVAGFAPRLDVERRRFQRDHRTSLLAQPINATIVDRTYQHLAIRKVHEAFETGHRRVLLVMATGTGKTRVATALVDTLLEAKWAQRVLFLADRDALVEQALRDGFKEFLPAEPADRIRSARYDATKRLYVATLQTMHDYHQQFSPAAFDVVISDESHRSIYNLWQDTLNYFDAYLVGLTATPADYLDRNTFTFFDRPDHEPTYSYEYDEAVQEGYLVPFEVYHARTRFQIDGIHGDQLDPVVQEQLRDEGIDPDDIDFSGTELERTVTNKDTTRLQVNEFFDNALTDPGGALPGKSILFATTHAHARRIWEVFNEEYPQFPGLAVIIDSHMERPAELLERFRKESMPRIAISVDMLDTGIDIPTVVNLGFFKPVFSRIKFWQMIGRGTRRVDTPAVAKDWCPVSSKIRFRILDFGENFARFQLNPDGVEPSATTPVATRRFRALSTTARLAERAHRIAESTGTDTTQATLLYAQLIAEMRQMIAALPIESAGVRERRQLIEAVSRDSYWLTIDEAKQRVLSLEVAPLMRYLADVNVAETTYDIHCLDAIAGVISGDGAAASAAARTLREDIIRLPVDHPDVAPAREAIVARYEEDWCDAVSLDELLELRRSLGPVMRHRLPEPMHLITLDLADVFREQRWIEVGPDARRIEISEYQQQVIARVQELAGSDPLFAKIAAGDPLDDDELAAVAAALDVPDLYASEDALQRAWRAPQASTLAILRDILGIERLPTREDTIGVAFNAYVMAKGYLNADQLTFVRLIARRLIDAGHVDMSDLYEAPFTDLTMNPEGLLPGDDLDELLGLAAQYSSPKAA
jgi:type I restriction enzyme R subunit